MPLKPLLSSQDMTWRTPHGVLQLVRRVGEISLDPCSGEGSIVGAKVTLDGTADADGLSADWHALAEGGLVYVNPPYGRAISSWVEKCAIEHLERGVEVILLTPSRTDTAWWHTGVRGCASAVCFWSGRITFLGAKHGAPFPSAVIYYGARVERFRTAFASAGWIVTP
jgi:phage N-6-adenine-methyltransferase